MITLFYIIALAINLTSNYSKEFNLSMDNSNIKSKCHIAYIEKNAWRVNLLTINKESPSSRILYNFEIKKDSFIVFPLDEHSTRVSNEIKQPIRIAFNLNDFFEINKNEQKNINQSNIKVKKRLSEKQTEEEPILVQKEKNKLVLTQEQGFLKDQKITVEW